MYRNGKFNKTCRYLASQAKKAAFALLAISVRLNHPSVTVMLRLYDALITPIMSYGCEIWGFKEDRDLEKVEIKFLKSILHLPDSTPTMAVRGELGQLPIFLLWKESTGIDFALRISLYFSEKQPLFHYTMPQQGNRAIMQVFLIMRATPLLFLRAMVAIVSSQTD